MEYRLIPFEPAINKSDPTGSATDALASAVQPEVNAGWEFVGIENHSTVVPGSSGCFGFGATNPYPKTMSILVFRK